MPAPQNSRRPPRHEGTGGILQAPEKAWEGRGRFPPQESRCLFRRFPVASPFVYSIADSGWSLAHFRLSFLQIPFMTKGKRGKNRRLKTVHSKPGNYFCGMVNTRSREWSALGNNGCGVTSKQEFIEALRAETSIPSTAKAWIIELAIPGISPRWGP